MSVSVDRESKRLIDNPVVLPLALLALVVGGGAMRLFIARQDLFGDELATYWVVSTRGLKGVVETVATTAEITPPFSFVLTWLTTRIGLSPEMVRLSALVAGIASIPLVYAVGVRTVGRGAAFLAATLTTLSPFMIFYSTEARGYGVLMALLLLSTLALLMAIDEGRGRWWVAYGAFVCLAAYTHYTAIFVLAAQLGWAFWEHRRARRPLVLATAAAVLLYLPWLPSVKGDLDSPTTKILSAFTPLSVEGTRLTLGHWSLGYPFAGPERGINDLPGALALWLLAACLCVGAYGIFTMRSRLGEWFADHEGRVGLVVLLALATPVGTFLQSVVGTNVFSTRSLAPSWPYLALAVAALVTVGRPAVRSTAAALAVARVHAGRRADDEYDLPAPEYTKLAQFAADQGGGVVVDGAGFAAGPFTNLDVEESNPGVPVFRLNVPEQNTRPFGVGEPLADPADLARRAVAAADGGPIVVMSFVPTTAAVTEFIDLLPDDYELTDTRQTEGLLDLEAMVFERRPAG